MSIEEQRTTRLKRGVAHGARAIAQDEAEKPASVAAAPDVVEPAGRPKATSGTFFTFQGDTTRELFTLAWPIAAAMLGETAMGLVDTKLVSGLGAPAIGGVGLGATVMYLGYALVFGVMRGVKVCTSHAIGEGRAKDGYAYARAGLVIGLLLGTVELVLCRDVGPALQWFGVDAAIIPYARDFLSAVTLGAPAACALSSLIQHRQAIGDSRTPMVVGIACNVLNAILAWGLIYGHFGLAPLGVRGAGSATAVVQTLEIGVLFYLLLRQQRREQGGEAALPFGRAAREVLSLGGPTGIQYVLEMVAFTTFTVVIGGIGQNEIAAHQIALNLIRVSFLPGIAISEAASVLIGRALGARRLDRADAVAKSALAMAVGFMAACGIVFALGGGTVARFFATDTAVVAIARRLLVVAAIFQILDAVNIVLRGALRGAKDVRVVMFLGIFVVWSCIPTSAYLLGKVVGLGALGGWLGFVAETTVGATIFWLRWKYGGWRRGYVAEARA